MDQRHAAKLYRSRTYRRASPAIKIFSCTRDLISPRRPHKVGGHRAVDLARMQGTNSGNMTRRGQAGKPELCDRHYQEREHYPHDSTRARTDRLACNLSPSYSHCQHADRMTPAHHDTIRLCLRFQKHVFPATGELCLRSATALAQGASPSGDLTRL